MKIKVKDWLSLTTEDKVRLIRCCLNHMAKYKESHDLEKV